MVTKCYVFILLLSLAWSFDQSTYASESSITSRITVGCPDNCDSCIDETTCQTCMSGFLINNGVCETCPAGQYLSGATCTNCTATCATCTSATTCQTCKSGFGLKNNTCGTCSQGTYISNTTGVCTSCPSTCYNCTDANTCLTCKTEFILESSQCVCPTGQYKPENKTYCRDCATNCTSCSDKSTCLTCLPNYGLYKSKCVICPSGTYLSEDNICLTIKRSFTFGSDAIAGIAVGAGIIVLVGVGIAIGFHYHRKSQNQKIHAQGGNKVKSAKVTDLGESADVSARPLQSKQLLKVTEVDNTDGSPAASPVKQIRKDLKLEEPDVSSVPIQIEQSPTKGTTGQYIF